MNDLSLVVHIIKTIELKCLLRILKKKQYLKQNHSISVKVSEIYFGPCMSNKEDVHIAKSIPLVFGDTSSTISTQIIL
jgi:hypothetical protein